MKRCLVLLFVLAVLCVAVGANAWTFSVRTNLGGATVPAGTDWTLLGTVNTVGLNYTGQLLPSAMETHPISGSVVKFGENNVSIIGAPVVDNWLLGGTPANFEFDVDVSATNTPGITASRHRMTVFGNLTGTGTAPGDIGFVGAIPFSNTKWVATGILDNTTATWYPYVSGTTNPNNGLAAVFANPIVDGLSVPLNIWINLVQDVPAPLDPPLSISGYINAVPEPSAMALLIGMGVSGSAFLMRRRKG